MVCCAERGSNNEGTGVSKEDLRQVQGDYSQRRGTCDLREPQAQAAPGISQAWQKAGGFHICRQLSAVSRQLRARELLQQEADH